MTTLRAVSRSSSARGAALIVFVAVVAFSNTFSNGFHLDDFYRVVDNPAIQRVAPISRHFGDPRTMSTLDRITQYRPLLPLTLSLNYWWGGASPVSHHVVNVAVHVAAALLAYALMLELLAPGAALAAALLFAVHPVSGIVVNYVSARDLGMMLAFLLGSLLVYARMRRGGDSPVGWAGALALAACSILSKTNAVALPLLVLAFELLILRADPRRLGAWLRAAAFGLVPAAYFAWTRFGLGFSDLQQVEGSASRFDYLWTQLGVHLVYLGNFPWPFAIRQMPRVVASEGLALAPLLGGTVLCASLWLAWRWRGSRPALAFGVCGYWILMLPESSLLPLHHLRADYRPYPSSVFLFLLVAHGVAQRVTRAQALAVTAAATTALLAASLYLNRTWRTEETLWTHSVRHGGDEVAHMNLAMSIADRRDPRVRSNLERALELAPGYVLARVNYGLLLIELGERERGLAECEQAVRLAPRWAQAHYWAAVAYERLGRQDAAEAAARTASLLDPENVGYAYEASLRAQRAGRYEESLALLRSLERRAPEHAPALFLKAFALQMTHRTGEAVETYARFLAARPDDFQARFNLGHALMKRGECREAIAQFQRTLELRPGYAEARVHIARCAARLRETDAAGGSAKLSFLRKERP